MFQSPARPSIARPRFVTRILIKPFAQCLAVLGPVLVAMSFVLPSAWAQTSIFNCSGFNANTSGACSVHNASGAVSQQFWVRNSPASTGSLPAIQLLPPNAGHNGFVANYVNPVTITAFTTTFTFIPNGQNLAFIVQNTSNQSPDEGNIFVSGAGCEGGFYQGSPNPGMISPNNIFALQVADAQDGLTYAGGGAFLYPSSSVQMFQSGIVSCLPNQIENFTYVSTNRISTSPVQQMAVPGTQFSTTGHVYSVTMTYTGSNITMQMFDSTLGFSCPGANCFTHTWPVYIPSIVKGTTAFIGIGEGGSVNLPGGTYIDSWSYTQLSAAATPTFSPAAGTYSGTQSVTISDATGSNYICYNTTGAPATNGIGGCVNSTLYTGAISAAKGQTVYAVAGVANGAGDSAIGSAAYNITGSASTPIFNQPGAAYFQGNQTVQLTTAQGGVICYNTTGSPATNGSTGCTTGTLYTTPISVASTETLYAVAGGTGFTDSPVGSVLYTINPFWDGSSPSGQAPATAPTFSPAPGTYSGTQTVTISSSATGSTTPYICYVLASSPPTLTPQTDNQTGACAAGTLYTGPISVSSTQTLYAMAGTNYASLPSSLVKGTYTISPSGGSPSPAPPTLLGAQVH